MNSIKITDYFLRKLKRANKKHPSIKIALGDLITLLEQDANIGESLGAGLHKIRLAVDSKGGKSGEFRLISYIAQPILDTSNDDSIGYNVWLVELYDKSEIDSILKSELLKIVRNTID